MTAPLVPRMNSVPDGSRVVPILARQAAPHGPDHLACRQELNKVDANGKFNLRYVCGLQRAVLNWGFRLSPGNQKTVVGPVTERGWTWFRNSVPQLQYQGTPHVVDATYQFHAP